MRANLFPHVHSAMPTAASQTFSDIKAGPVLPVQDSAPIRIGILAHKGTEICRKMWQPTMAYLDKELPGRHFELVPLQFAEVASAIKNKSIDFLICNPAIYVEMEVKYGVTRIMTLRNRVGTQIVSEFGSVIFCRADRTALQGLPDARGQRLAATGRNSFGGWQMALREFRAAGIDPERDCAQIDFLDSHLAVVRAVFDGTADIGIVRTDTLERMAADGEIQMDAVRVISAKCKAESHSTFPYLHSTRLYPEWPLAKLSGTTEDLSRKLTVALLSMRDDSPAALAAESGGWSVCLNYTSVHDCLRELRIAPYENHGQIGWADIWQQYWPWLVAITALVIALLAALLFLRGRQHALMRISNQNRLLLASAGEGICGIDLNGTVTFVNPAAEKMLGYTAAELLGKNLHALTHHTKPDGQPYPSHECPIYKACKNGTIYQGSDELFYRKDGDIFPVSYSTRPIIDRGRITGAVICLQDIAERKQAEALQIETLNRLEKIASRVPGLVYQYRLRPDGSACLPFASEAVRDIFRVSPEEVREDVSKIFANLHPDDYDGVGASIQKSAQDLTPWQHEFRVEFDDGAIRSLYGNAVPQREEDGSVLWHGFITDITERKRVEQELQVSEARLRTITDSAQDAILMMDPKGAITFWNPAAESILGYRNEEAIGQNLHDLLVPEHYLQAHHTAFPEFIRTGLGNAVGKTVELIARRKGGQEITIALSLSAVSLNGEWHAVGILHDITAQKQVEAALRESEAKHRLILDHSSDLIWSLNLKGVFTYVSPSWKRVTGHELSSIPSLSSFHPLVHPDDFAACSAHLSQVHDTKETGTIPEYRVRHADGSWHWHSATVTPVLNPAGEVVSVVGVSRDVTDQKHTEELLKKWKDELERYAAALESSVRDLEASKETAETATRAKSEFLANMSHEIRTPMTAILGYADLLINEKGIEKAPPQRQQNINAIKRNGEHLLGLINDILDLSKIEAGKMQIEPIRFSPFELITEVVSLMRVRADTKQLRLETNFVGLLPETVLIDPLRLRQILVNLIGNAIKFSDQGEVRITTRLNSDDSSPRLRIDVSDNGIGMNEEQVGKLFQAFSQVDNSATRKFGGTGLGLCICKRLIEAMGGNIEVCSTPGKGSTFSIMINPGSLEGIPIVQQRVPMMQPTKAPANVEKIALHSRILLAEDGPDNQRLICIILEEAGAEVAAVENGQLAVEAALAASKVDKPFDVILMDMQMPVMDGYAATQELRRQGYLAPIIALTAHAMSDDRQKCLDAGCDDFATKPIDWQKLLATVAHWIVRQPDESSMSQDGTHASETNKSVESLRSNYAEIPVFADILPEFVGCLEARVQSMNVALANGQFEELRRLAHQLKGAGGSYGYPTITEVAKTLEFDARDGRGEAAKESLARIAVLCRAAIWGLKDQQVSVPTHATTLL